ncbi:PQQ-binding-like beta-propeller repeat protein [Halobacteria archaeon HArc-gm2]|nr:PQQ-binding-like beta-propeller repeat protein [Halobacteria archaeon HArc-gm2]
MASSFERRKLLTATGATFGSLLAGCSYSSGPQATLSHDRIIWHRSPVSYDIAIVDDALYFSTGTDLYSIETGTGEERWSRHVEDEPNLHSDETTCLRKAVAADSQRIYVPSCDGVRALSLQDGSDLWTAGSAAMSSVVATGSHVYAGGSDLISVSRSSETEEWLTAIGAREELSLAPTDDGVVACNEAAGVVHCMDADGTSRWQHDLEWEGRPPVVAADTVYAATGRDQEIGRLVALDRSTGSVNWTAETPAISPSGITTGDEQVYVGTYPDENDDGRLVAYDQDSGEMRWDYTVRDSDFASPLADASGVYAGTDHGVYAFSHDGTERWYVETEYPTSCILVSDGQLYAGVMGELVAIDVTGDDR